MNDKRIIYTIGHSNHTAKEFLAILRAFGIKKLIDVRTIPRSRQRQLEMLTYCLIRESYPEKIVASWMILPDARIILLHLSTSNL